MISEGKRMVKVSKITQQKKNKEFYNVYLDGNFAFGIHGELVILYGIKEGRELDLEEMEKIIKEDNKKRAFNHSLHYLSYRRRTTWQVEEYLRKKDYIEEIIDCTIKKLKDYKMIDDSAYIRDFISEKILGNPAGRKKIKYDLQNKGINEAQLSLIEKYYTGDEEYQQAKRLVMKYEKKYKNLPKIEQRNKINQAGQRRGFSWEIMKRAIEDTMEEIEEDGQNIEPQEVDMHKAREWAQKYKGRYEKKGLTGFHLKQKTSQALMRRGYKWEVIEKVLKEVE